MIWVVWCAYMHNYTPIRAYVRTVHAYMHTCIHYIAFHYITLRNGQMHAHKRTNWHVANTDEITERHLCVSNTCEHQVTLHLREQCSTGFKVYVVRKSGWQNCPVFQTRPCSEAMTPVRQWSRRHARPRYPELGVDHAWQCLKDAVTGVISTSGRV